MHADVERFVVFESLGTLHVRSVVCKTLIANMTTAQPREDGVQLVRQVAMPPL
jgi:hypothetical protein